MDKSVLKVTISHYGEQRQVVKAIEELAELQKELSKFIGGCMDGSFVNNTDVRDRTVGLVTAEMADVYVMLEQLQMIFGNKTAVEAIIESKVTRLKHRVEG